MKFGKLLVTGLLAAALLVPAAQATHTHGPQTTPTFEASAWAQPELQKAYDLGLLCTDLPDDYRYLITRADFCRMMVNYLAVELNTDADALIAMTELYLAKDGETPFTDCQDQAVNAAYYLGLVQGKAPGIFWPESYLSREEAAVMLLRAQEILGYTTPKSVSAPDYSDREYIADWALDATSLLQDWDVMHGMAYDRFNPRDDLDVQQCAVICLRLHEKAPVGLEKDNVQALFTYDQAMGYLQDMENRANSIGTGYHKTLELVGSQATLVRMDWGGSMQATSQLYLAYPDGGLQTVDLGLCLRFNTLTPDLKLDDPRFSEDGSTFLCEVRLAEDSKDSTTGTTVVTHQKGLYHVSVDVATCQVTLDREALSA